jgi:hypothetical protein
MKELARRADERGRAAAARRSQASDYKLVQSSTHEHSSSHQRARTRTGPQSTLKRCQRNTTHSTPTPTIHTHTYATLTEEAELIFSVPFHNYLIENDLERYTLKRPQQVHASNIDIDHIKQQYKRWVPETMQKQKTDRIKGLQWEP